jgi:hypothetical protein
MNILKLNYNTLSPEDKKLWVKAEFERQRAKHNAPVNGLSAQLREAFSDLACRLSPENLHCDGEITRVQAQRKYNQIMKEWNALEKKAGRKVGESEFPY